MRRFLAIGAGIAIFAAVVLWAVAHAPARIGRD